MSRLRPLSESECYARLYGDREPTVAVLRDPDSGSALERPGGGLVGEQIMKLFSERLRLSAETRSEEEAA